MSTKLNGTRFSQPGSRVPTHLLETAIDGKTFGLRLPLSGDAQ